jgi:MSHA biogenesis protein MshL
MNCRIPSRLFFPALAALILAGGAFARDNAPAANPVAAAPAVEKPAAPVAEVIATGSIAASPAKVETSISATAISSALFSFRADNVPIKQALALFARANHLNIVPDLDVEGAVTVEFQDLPLDQAMHALLEANGYYFEPDGRLLRVRNHETRLFQIDYIHMTRSGQGSNAVQISSSGNSGSGSSGTTTGASGASGGSSGNEGSTMTVTNTSTINFWGDLADQLKSMVSSSGSYTINSLAGTVLVRDSHRNVETIAQFIASVTASIVRQIDLDVEIYEVALNDSSQLGVNWSYIADSLHTNFNTIPGQFGLGTGGGLIVQTPVYGTPPGDPGIRAQYQHGNLSAVLDALKQQGNLRVVSRPRLRTLNNQPAVVRVGQDLPVFIRQVLQSPGTPPVITTNETIQTITVGTVLSITPQVSSDGLITLDITPAVSRLVRTDTSASGETNAPVIDIRQASSIVRVRDGATIIMGGLVQDSSSSTHRKIPLLGDIPWLGKAFSGEYKTSERTELVFFLTPKIIQDTAGEKSVKLAGF